MVKWRGGATSDVPSVYARRILTLRVPSSKGARHLRTSFRGQRQWGALWRNAIRTSLVGQIDLFRVIIYCFRLVWMNRFRLGKGKKMNRNISVVIIATIIFGALNVSAHCRGGPGPALNESSEGMADLCQALDQVDVSIKSSLNQSAHESLWKAFAESRRTIRSLSELPLSDKSDSSACFYTYNPHNKLNVRFMDDRVKLMTEGWENSGSGTLSLMSEDEPLVIRRKETRLEYVRNGIVEWYQNRPEGLEHGFIVTDPSTKYSTHTNGQLIVTVGVEGLKVLALEGENLQFVNEAGEAKLAYSDLKVWDADGQDLHSFMEPTASGFQIVVADAGASYPITIDPLITSLEQKLSPTVMGSGDAGDYAGFSVDISGNTALIGAYQDDESMGSVYVFVHNGTNWVERAKLFASDGVTGDGFGYSVSLSDDTAVIGSKFDDDSGVSSGSAYVFVYNGTNWVEQAKLTSSDGALSDFFGHSVDVSGDTALVGSFWDDDLGSMSGSAYIFVRSGTNWIEQAKLLASDGVGSDYFGCSVSLSGDTALVGAYGNDDFGSFSGSAYIFVRNGTVWTEQDKLLASDGAAGDYFGTSVSLSEDTALVGAYGDDDLGDVSGSAYVFVRAGTVWTEQDKLLASDGVDSDYFGYSVSVSGDTALIGAKFDNDSGVSSGSAYVFVRTGTNWNEQVKLLAGDGIDQDQFGSAVAISGDRVLVGAYLNDDSGVDSGSAYIFIRNGTNWTAQTKFSAGDSSAGDQFGNAVSVSGNTAVIGAYTDNALGDESGSAYVFIREGAVWSEQAKLFASDGAAGDLFASSVSLFGDSIVIGAPANSGKGASYVFVRSGSDWSEQAKLVASDAALGDWFGNSVSIFEDSILVGAWSNDDPESAAGSAYVFMRSGSNWSEQAKLLADDGDRASYFGFSVSLFQDTALIGSYGDFFHDAGAYVFTRSGTSWSQKEKLMASDQADGDSFGYSVSLSGTNTAVVGSYKNNDAGSSSGCAYVFTYDGANWSEQTKLIAADASAGDQFGYSVSATDGFVVIGANGDDGLQGSAYVFGYNGTNWVEQSKLVAPDGVAGDQFGYAVHLDGDTAFVGALQHDGPDSYGHPAADQGTAYVFCLADAVNPDSDGDGMPDAWEIYYSLNVGVNDSGDDPDGDGQDNLSEYIAGLNPKNSTSLFHITEYELSATNRILGWSGTTGRYYNVLWATNLMSEFQLLDSDLEYPQNTYTDLLHSAEDKGFYKVEVRLIP